MTHTYRHTDRHTDRQTDTHTLGSIATYSVKMTEHNNELIRFSAQVFLRTVFVFFLMGLCVPIYISGIHIAHLRVLNGLKSVLPAPFGFCLAVRVCHLKKKEERALCFPKIMNF